MAKKKPDPKLGTGKKPKGSGRRLYTDENPKDTVSIKFATVSDAKLQYLKLKRLISLMQERYKYLLSLNNEPRYLGRRNKQPLQKKQKNN